MALNFFKKKKQNTEFPVKAPFNGQIVPLEKVPDEVFAQKILGDGVAIIPEDAATITVCAPIEGTVSLVADTGHAVGMTTAEGVEFLLHYGLETVALNGDGFKPLVSAGKKIKIGDPILEVDSAAMKAKGINQITMLVISDAKDYTYTLTTNGDAQTGETPIMQFTKA